MSFNHFPERFGTILKLFFQHWDKFIKHTFQLCLLQSSNSSLSMWVVKWVLFVWISIFLFSHHQSNVEGRSHFHKKQKNKSSSKGSPVPQPPDYSPPQDPSPPPPPPVPSDPNDGGNSSSEPCIFDVTTFGAVGDGSSDDTAAFRSAWKEACAVENGVLLAPSGYDFTITSTIFSGPCKPGLVFQVRH